MYLRHFLRYLFNLLHRVRSQNFKFHQSLAPMNLTRYITAASVDVLGASDTFTFASAAPRNSPQRLHQNPRHTLHLGQQRLRYLRDST